MSTADELKNIFNLFNADGDFHDASDFGKGHIHDTYRIAADNCQNDYLLQRINTKIFADVPSLQDNIYRVTSHLCKKLREEGEEDIVRKCLTLIKTKDGKTWVDDHKGGFWRMFIFIADHYSYDIVQSPRQAYEGGKAIGRFQALLADLPGPRLNETIPFFHNVEKRLETFHRALSDDVVSRVAGVRKEIDFALVRQEEMMTIERLGEKNIIPLRITHNDTKFNNILFDKNDRALCLIDLDTVMPGYVHYDFGDALRTAANTSSEDEEDLSKIDVNMEIYKSFTLGYLSQVKSVLNNYEIEYLPYSPALMTFIMGLRFLTDYIMGDVYYKVCRKDHNIARSRAQFRLVEKFEKKLDAMRSIIFKTID